MGLETADLKNPEKVLGQFGTLETRLAALETQLATMNQPLSSDNTGHPAGFCEQSDTCSICQPYVEHAKAEYVKAHNNGVTAGRNNVIDKLNQAAIDLDRVPELEILAARMAQMEAEGGDVHAQTLIIRGVNGELVGVKG